MLDRTNQELASSLSFYEYMYTPKYSTKFIISV